MTGMSINKYLPFAFIYFFVNSLALPFGLTYTAILSPLFYWWIVTSRKKEILLPFFVCLAPFFIFYFLQIILNQNKINSWLLLLILLLPYALSFSLGVIGSVTIAGILTYILYFKTLSKKRRVLNIFMLLLIISLSSLAIALI